MNSLKLDQKENQPNKIGRLLNTNPKIIVIHVTDTYFIEESKINDEVDLPGFARLYSLIDHIKSSQIVQENKIPAVILHGGDFLYPSLMSTHFHGQQMVEVLNYCGFNYCTLGNHDFDGGVKSLKTRMSEAAFDIICANIKDSKRDPMRISGYVVCNDKNEQPSAAVIGIAGEATLRKARQNGFETTSIESSLKQTIVTIKKNHPSIDQLIILSHMSNEEDVNLEQWLVSHWEGWFYVLGGHDHNEVLQYNDKNPKSVLLKGQSNCRTVQVIGVNRDPDFKNLCSLPENICVLNSTDVSKFPPKLELEAKIRTWESKLEKHLDEPESDKIIKQFKTNTVLDATELQLRKGSTNFGNFIADCMCTFASSDIALINSGHFRGDRRIGNILRLFDLRRIFVLDKKDSLVKIIMTREECIEFLIHAYTEEGRGKILQLSKNTLHILQESKPKEEFTVVLLWDMLKTNDDGFTTILANSRKTDVGSIISEIKKYVIPESSLFDVVENSSKNVEYDPSIRLSVEKISKTSLNATR
ncbi:metallophosphoesterase [Nitrosopumilus sp.]|uniref:metallophosphoesterase n=1 Tax=Nitrosopumilus sp. TaxID=2024843 RepID=UPI0029308534|nr:metallophosphoesterase [Nitrosopumilus sp.]